MVACGRPVTEVAEALGIGSNVIYRWISKGKREEPSAMGSAEPVFDEDKAALYTRIRELEMERDILKKALAIFSRPM